MGLFIYTPMLRQRMAGKSSESMTENLASSCVQRESSDRLAQTLTNTRSLSCGGSFNQYIIREAISVQNACSFQVFFNKINTYIEAQ